jgi:hypothetical protein
LDSIGQTQLLAEMKILWVNLPDTEKHAVIRTISFYYLLIFLQIFGVLTTGIEWMFVFLDSHGHEYYITMKSASAYYNFEEDEGIIVTFLHYFMLQQLPPGVTHN